MSAMRDLGTVRLSEEVRVHESEHVVRHGRFAGVAQGRILVDNGGPWMIRVPVDSDWPHVTDKAGRVLGFIRFEEPLPATTPDLE